MVDYFLKRIIDDFLVPKTSKQELPTFFCYSLDTSHQGLYVLSLSVRFVQTSGQLKLFDTELFVVSNKVLCVLLLHGFW